MEKILHDAVAYSWWCRMMQVMMQLIASSSWWSDCERAFNDTPCSLCGRISFGLSFHDGLPHVTESDVIGPVQQYTCTRPFTHCSHAALPYSLRQCRHAGKRGPIQTNLCYREKCWHIHYACRWIGVMRRLGPLVLAYPLQLCCKMIDEWFKYFA